MEIPLTGGCQCGKLRYELSEAPRLVYCCHCTSCQRITASAFSISAVVIEEAFHLTAGQPPRGLPHRRQWPHVCSLGLSRLRNMHYRRSKSGRGVSLGTGRLIGRYILVATDSAYLDVQQAAMDHAAPRS